MSHGGGRDELERCWNGGVIRLMCSQRVACAGDSGRGVEDVRELGQGREAGAVGVVQR